jgi:general secretion pathway protein F
VSVVDCNLLKEKPVQKYPATENAECSQATEQPYRRDIFRRTGTKELCRLARQLATLLRAGMPLVPALSALAEQLRAVSGESIVRSKSHVYLAEIMEQVAEDVNTGSTLSDALGKHPAVFSQLFVKMVAAGQASGTLEQVLVHLAEMLERRVRIADKVKAAVAYPAMMTVVAITVVVFLLSFVVPSITEIFIEMNQSLPWPTRLLISISSFLKAYLLGIIVVVCVIIFGTGIWLRSSEARLLVDRTKLKLPVFGRLFLKLETARLARTLGTLLLNGIPILNALQIARGVIRNSFIAAALGSVKEQVGKGETIAESIRKTTVFPPIVSHLIATGQISGEIESGLLSIADMYEDEVEQTSQTLMSLLEPAILLAMGVIIGFIVLAILLPIFEINQMI